MFGAVSKAYLQPTSRDFLLSGPRSAEGAAGFRRFLQQQDFLIAFDAVGISFSCFQESCRFGRPNGSYQFAYLGKLV